MQSKTKIMLAFFCLVCLKSIMLCPTTPTTPTTPPQNSQVNICPATPKRPKKRKRTSDSSLHKSRKTSTENSENEKKNFLNQPNPFTPTKKMLYKLENSACRTLLLEVDDDTHNEINDIRKLIINRKKLHLSKKPALSQQKIFAYLLGKNQVSFLNEKIPYHIMRGRSSTHYHDALEHSTTLPFQKNLHKNAAYADVTVKHRKDEHEAA